jgi:hypothetical protein
VTSADQRWVCRKCPFESILKRASQEPCQHTKTLGYVEWVVQSLPKDIVTCGLQVVTEGTPELTGKESGHRVIGRVVD